MNKKKVILIALVLVELVVSIGVCWIGYKHILFERQKKFAAVIRKDQMIRDTSSELQYYYDFQPSIDVEDHPSWLSYTARYTINKDGLNERYDYPVEKPKNTFRILTLGDSFTFGHYVNTADNWTEKVEDLLNTKLSNCSGKKFEVINLGMRGFDIPYITQRYRKNGEKYDADLILWMESGSGFNRVNELRMPYIQKCNDEANEVNTKTSDPKKMYDCYNEVMNQSLQKYSPEQISTYLSSYMDRFFTDVGNKRVIFYTFSNIDDQYINELKSWSQKGSNSKVYATLPDLSQSSGLLPDGHPNAKGHDILANQIFEELKANELSAACASSSAK